MEREVAEFSGVLALPEWRFPETSLLRNKDHTLKIRLTLVSP